MDRDSSPGQVDFLDDDDDYDSYYEFAGNVVQEQEDNGQTDLQQVTERLREDGLASINVIFGISSKRSNAGRTCDPYEEIISILGKTLAPVTKGNMFSCFGFGDKTTQDKNVFSFQEDHKPCEGIKNVLYCYRKIVRNMQAGLTSFAPIIDAAIDIVVKNEGQFHTLFIITDDQVTRGINISDDELSPQEEQTMKSIYQARLYPLSIVVIGVGAGTRENMPKFEKISPCKFENEFQNFKFVNFTKYMSNIAARSDNETAFAIAALMDIPTQYKKATELGLLGHVTRSANGINPLPPPRAPYSESPTDLQVCPVCKDEQADFAFNCGHRICEVCGEKLRRCHICRAHIKLLHRVYL